ncbi:MAG: inositol monophosphatase family protein [Candidatus Thermoplasmatota archaeon]|nr:inositol monophosphatase family protein [Candidatus Thermoplasmatota archaeon]
MNDLDIIKEIAERIRDAVMDRYPDGGGGAVVSTAPDGSMTREIDLAAERCAIDHIEENDLPWNLLSEEDGSFDGRGERTLILDPIDGTYNAIHGIPLFSTSLALCEGPLHNITSSLVMNIPVGMSFTAVKGEGANYNDKAISTRNLDEAMAVFNSFLGPASLEENRLLFSWPYRGRYFGSISLEVCYVAKGAIDLFALFWRIPRITDIAGAYLILKEAGGHIMIGDHRSTWSDYMPSLDHPGSRDLIVMGDASSKERILQIISQMNPCAGGLRR